MRKGLQIAAGAEPIAGYRLTRFLGRGGWGEVWQATAPQGEDVALKFLPCDSHTSAAQEIRALQSIRSLSHPYLLETNQVWSVANYLVIGMELAEGSLMDLLEVCHETYNTGIGADHLCYYLGHAAEALDFLNTRQHLIRGQRMAIRHCDVKPSNILLFDGVAKLADFSLTVTTSSPQGYFRRVGTLQFAGPEIFQGWLSEQSDQFALAVTYCVLRGARFPFLDTPKTFDKSYTRPKPDLSMISELERPVVAKALDPTPQNRWHSCTEFITNLMNCGVPSVSI